MIEIHLTDESGNERPQRPADEDAGFYDDANDDELGFFGIVVKRKSVSSCPYNEKGEYVPRNLRR